MRQIARSPFAIEDFYAWFHHHANDLSREQGMKLIALGAGLLLLAEAIAYVPISLYAENGRELLKDYKPKKS